MEQAPTADFDRILSSMVGLPDTKITKPSTQLDIYPMLHEKNVTFVVQTHRTKDSGFTIFLTIVDAQGSRRVVIPAKVSAVIYRQRQSLTDRSTPESRRRKQAAANRAKAKKAKDARRAAYVSRNPKATAT